jgi:CRISPR-associated endoribonuclease Cas6
MTLLLKPLNDLSPVPLGSEWRGTLLSEIASRAGVPEERLRKRPAPFSISSPMPVEATHPAEGIRADQGRLRLRLGWLADEDVRHLVDWAKSLRAEPVRVETKACALLLEDGAVSSTLTQRWNRWIPYSGVYEEASDCLRAVTLKFYSPTTLDRSGHPYPLPDPPTIFLGYKSVWDAFSGVALAPGLRDAIEQHLLLVDFRIQRRLFESAQGPVPGFIGSATFRLGGRHPESILKGLNVLADYAFFCGTGIGTEMGMGLTRRIVQGEGRT